jgi:hypothetical protein
VYARLTEHIEQLNREGRGIKMHWHYGLQIDFRTWQHRVASYTASKIHVCHYTSRVVRISQLCADIPSTLYDVTRRQHRPTSLEQHCTLLQRCFSCLWSSCFSEVSRVCGALKAARWWLIATLPL